MNIRTVTLVAICAAASLSSCGGGGGGRAPIAGIDGGGVRAQGPIASFGSIFVNGVEYSTNRAAVFIAGTRATDRDLKVGQLVTVAGTAGVSGSMPAATRIDYAPTILGPVQSIDALRYELVAAAIAVRIVAATSFGGGVGSLEALRAGDFVEISGYSDGAGGVIASRIERRAAGEVEVRGVVNNLDTAAKTFDIASLHVDYSAAGVLTNLPGGVPSNGDFVAAAGTFDGMALHASRIAREDATLDGKSGDHAEVEGAITLVISPSALQVGVQRVVTTSSTMFEQGSAADLAVGSIVEAEGTLDGTGQLVAARIQFRQEGELQLTGTVMSIAAAQHTFDLLGRTIEVNSLTRFEDDSSGSMPLSFASLNISDFLEVRAYESGTRTVATRIKREPAQSEVDLRGTPSAFALPLFELLGQIIITDAATEFRDGSQPIDQVTFFALAPLGSRLVRVKGTSESTTTIRAAEVRLED